MEHKWEQTSGFSYRCSRCKAMDDVGADWCDTNGITKEVERIAARDDCPGRRRKARRKPKLVYTRDELLVVDDNHGGHLGGHCQLCGSSGWLDSIDHHEGCILADPTVTKVRIEAVRTAEELIESYSALVESGASKTKIKAAFDRIPDRFKRIDGVLKSKAAIKKLLKLSR